MTVDVIIPIYKPGKELLILLDKLKEQTVQISNIILLNTEEKYFEQLTYGTDFSKKYKNVSVYHVSKKEFDHGKTRRMGAKKSDADIFVMMTQDAVPADEFLIEKLIEKLTDDVVVSYGRQLPYENSSLAEKISRDFNYPNESAIKNINDIPRLGIKTYFCSNVCAAYRKDIYQQMGGFVKKTIFNEDMIYAAGVINKGYSVAYAADARVYHSHNYTNKQQFKRNFDLGVSQAQYSEIFDGVPSEAEGKRLVMETIGFYIENKKITKIPGFIIQCGCKYAGYKLGRNYTHLPKKLILKFTSNADYWN